jgi:hypothetical protein
VPTNPLVLLVNGATWDRRAVHPGESPQTGAVCRRSAWRPAGRSWLAQQKAPELLSGDPAHRYLVLLILDYRGKRAAVAVGNEDIVPAEAAFPPRSIRDSARRGYQWRTSRIPVGSFEEYDGDPDERVRFVTEALKPIAPQLGLEP